MRDYIIDFSKKHNFPQEAIETLLSTYDTLKNNQKFNYLIDSFYAKEPLSFQAFKTIIEEISKDENINPYSIYLTFYVLLTPALKILYREKKVDETIYHDTVGDLQCKLQECYTVKKVWGIQSIEWCYKIFRFEVFNLGRLQYCIGNYTLEDTEICGNAVKKGDKVITIHIPSSGKPFDRSSRLDSYEKAYYFYKDCFNSKKPLFMCDSWLIHPINKELLGEKSNISSFIDDFKIVHSSFSLATNSDLWRIFGADADLPPEQLPRNTSMQKAFAQWLEKGNTLGSGVGLFYYDPVNKAILK